MTYQPQAPPAYGQQPVYNQQPMPMQQPMQQPVINVVQQQQQQQQQQPSVVVVGGQGGGLGCRRCGATGLSDSFTCCGICLAIFFFPIGLICCFCMREKKCSGCGAPY
ncbi:uncharacterized protein LOC144743423 [Ciona intestinalis]